MAVKVPLNIKFRPVQLCSLTKQYRGESRATSLLISTAVKIAAEEHPMTLRHLFYRLLGTGQIENTRKDYVRVSRVMAIARKDGRCPWSWIVDTSRPEYSPNVWDDVNGYFETVKKGYRRDCWQDQPCYVEVWTEKDSITGSIEEVTHELGVTVRVFRGFSSATKAHDIAAMFREVGQDKDIQVFYLGDHDPSGIDIERDIAERIREFLSESASFRMERVAIHAADIKAFNLPPQKVKTGDTRHIGFLRDHGDKCVELDALPPTELRRRLKEAIESLIDRGPWDRHLVAEQVERASIIDFANRLASLPQGGEQC